MVNPRHLRLARIREKLTQEAAAALLGVSQPYYSQLESGKRSLPPELALAAVRKLKVSPVVLPLPELSVRLGPLEPAIVAAQLSRLGYPGFAHMTKARTAMSPAELVVRSLLHTDLDARLVEALPWLIAQFSDLNWGWLTAQCRLRDLQNRLGFVVTLANQLPQSRQNPLTTVLAGLEQSRLEAEGTLCRDSMSDAERRWLRRHRSPEAANWNLLSTLSAEQLTHAA